MEVQDMPALNASLNSLATLLLLAGFAFVRMKSVRAHRACMISALAVSAIFLASYVTHKILVGGTHTPFGGEGAIAWFYYAMLITHIILAMGVVPLALITFRHAIKSQIDRHRKWARWTYPIWLYVSVTGVLVYFFLYVWFPSSSA